MKVHILSERMFLNSILPKINELENSFFISIIDPDLKSHPFRDDCGVYRTWAFYDLEEDIQNYKTITEKQAKEIYDFIVQNKDKQNLYVHCAAGVSRSSAIGAFAHEYTGGAYKELLQRFPNILPNGRVTKLLRLYERIGDYTAKINFI